MNRKSGLVRMLLSTERRLLCVLKVILKSNFRQETPFFRYKAVIVPKKKMTTDRTKKTTTKKHGEKERKKEKD